MKCAAIPFSQLAAANRMDAGFHLAKKTHEVTERRLRETITRDQAAALVQHVLDNGPKLMMERLEPYARGNSPRSRLSEVPGDHPYEAAAMVVDSRDDIEAALADEVRKVATRQQGFADRFAELGIEGGIQ